jgi:geranylgeranyl diphosphate synthase, type I
MSTHLSADPLAILAMARDEVTPALRAAVARLDETTGTISGYHLGWTDAAGTPTPRGAGGKAVRPALALLSALAAGEDAQAALPGAVAVELVHNFSLVHDDLMDGDTERRHRATVWTVWGSANAILTGDALLALASEVLLESPSPHAGAAARLLNATARELIRGQALDLAFERCPAVSVAECREMAAGKTGALLATSAAIGALLAGGPADLVDALAAFGAELGLAFQLVDDLLGIWGDPATTGKPVWSDLRSRKKTLPVTYAASRRQDRASRAVARWLAGDETLDDAGLRRVADLIEAAGGRTWAGEEASRRLAAAERVLDRVEIPAAPRADLLELARFVVTRTA